MTITDHPDTITLPADTTAPVRCSCSWIVAAVAATLAIGGSALTLASLSQLTGYTTANDATQLSVACAVVGNPDYDPARCAALTEAATAPYLATVPKTDGGTCPRRSRHDCRASLGLSQTMGTAHWWAPWETPHGVLRLGVCMALGCAGGIVIAQLAGARRRAGAVVGLGVGFLSTSPAAYLPTAGLSRYAVMAVAGGLSIWMIVSAAPEAKRATVVTGRSVCARFPSRRRSGEEVRP